MRDVVDDRGKTHGSAQHNTGNRLPNIGAVGPIEFYQKVLGATVIEDSTPSVYAGMLRQA